MIAKFVFAIIVFIAAIIAAPIVGTNFTVTVSDISDNDIGFVRASCTNNGDGTFSIVIDQAVVNSPDFAVVFCHEIGHAVNWNGGEEDADNFANAQGVGYIHDATY